MVSKELLKKFDYCENPRYIVNKFTQQRIRVSCGSCPSCLLKQGGSKAFKCNIQQSLSKYTYFVTLTYATHFIPKAKINLVADLEDNCPDIVNSDRWNEYFQFTSIPRVARKQYIDFHDEQFHFRFYSKPDYIRNLVDKIDMTSHGVYPQYKNTVSYLNYADVQYFMKRLRFFLKQKIGNYEKIHTYVVGEYGPVHFRPHWHILFFFDSDRLSQNIRQSLRQAWRFGRVDSQLATNNAASYVASYVNGYSSLPYLYRSFSKVKPSSRFSNHFAQKAFEQKFTPSEECFSYFIDGVELPILGKSQKVRPWRSVYDRFFPRFYHDVRTDVHHDFKVVESLSRTDHELAKLGFINPSNFMAKSRFLFNLMKFHYEHHTLMPDWLNCIYVHSRVSQYLVLQPDEGIQAIYRLMFTYKYFCDNWLSHGYYTPDQYSQCIRALRTIRRFYDTVGYTQLVESLRMQEEYYSSPYISETDKKIDIFHDLSDPSFFEEKVSDTLLNHSLHRFVSAQNSIRFERSVKHKVLNDQNYIFTKDV